MSNAPIHKMSFDQWEINRMTPQQKSDAARVFLDKGFPREEVAKVFGEPNLTPTEHELARKERAMFLRLNWPGDKEALAVELKKLGY
jgi:hypothetical protein